MGKSVQLTGWLTKPSDAPRQAAVIYLGGCNGFDSLGKQYMADHLPGCARKAMSSSMSEAPRANAWGAYDDVHFRAIFAIYPRCYEKANYDRTRIRIHTMIVIGALDTSSKPEWCKPFKAVDGVEHRLKIYSGVYHSYMQPLKPREVVWADGSRHWFAPDPAAKADTVKEMKAWFNKQLR